MRESLTWPSRNYMIFYLSNPCLRPPWLNPLSLLTQIVWHRGPLQLPCHTCDPHFQRFRHFRIWRNIAPLDAYQNNRGRLASTARIPLFSKAFLENLFCILEPRGDSIENQMCYLTLLASITFFLARFTNWFSSSKLCTASQDIRLLHMALAPWGWLVFLG